MASVKTESGESQAGSEKARSTACEACRKRKVKCNGGHPCTACENSHLSCVYSSWKSGRSRRGIKRGKVITDYMTNSPLARIPHIRFSDEYIYSLIPYFMSGRYPVCPVLSEDEARSAVHDAVKGGEDGPLGYAIGAVALEYLNSKTGFGPDKQSIESLARLAIASRGPLSPDFTVSLKAVIASSFISDALVTAGKLDAAWLYLHEAIGMMNLLRIGESSTLAGLPENERARQLRVYWMLYVHERFLALHMKRSRLLLPPLTEYPTQVPDITPEVHRGFLCIVQLFEHVDQKFVNAFIGADSDVDDVDPQWIQDKANALESFASQLPSELTPAQQADQIISHQWMLVVLWQIAMSRFWLLSTTTTSGVMALVFPIEVTRKLQKLVTDIDTDAIEAQGYSINQKLYELINAISEVIPLIPPDRLRLEVGSIDSFVWIARYLLTQSTVLDGQKAILETKLDRITSMF